MEAFQSVLRPLQVYSWKTLGLTQFIQYQENLVNEVERK